MVGVFLAGRCAVVATTHSIQPAVATVGFEIIPTPITVQAVTRLAISVPVEISSADLYVHRVVHTFDEPTIYLLLTYVRTVEPRGPPSTTIIAYNIPELGASYGH